MSPETAEKEGWHEGVSFRHSIKTPENQVNAKEGRTKRWRDEVPTMGLEVLVHLFLKLPVTLDFLGRQVSK